MITMQSLKFVRLTLAAGLASILLTTAVSSYAAIYKWQDENGGWHFSEVPPDSQSVEKVDVRVTPPSSDVTQPPIPEKASSSDDTAADAATSDEKDQQMNKSAEIAAEDKARKIKNCQVAKTNLESLKRPRIRFRDEEQGVERYMDEDERKERIDKNQKLLKENC